MVDKKTCDGDDFPCCSSVHLTDDDVADDEDEADNVKGVDGTCKNDKMAPPEASVALACLNELEKSYHYGSQFDYRFLVASLFLTVKIIVTILN